MKINFKKTQFNIAVLKKTILDAVKYHIFLKRFVMDLLHSAVNISVKYLLTKLNVCYIHRHVWRYQWRYVKYIFCDVIAEW
jgi:hypothetical protein